MNPTDELADYGWPATLSEEEILERLVALNAQRAAEERRLDHDRFLGQSS